MFDDPKSEKSYDPDYKVPHTRKGKPPHLPQYLEMGILVGQSFVNKTISHIPKEEERLIIKSLKPNCSRIEQFLISNAYVITMMDRNLGIVVSEHTWLDDKCLELLNDVNNYTLLQLLMANQILDQQCKDMEMIGTLSKNLMSDSSNQLGKFFRLVI